MSFTSAPRSRALTAMAKETPSMDCLKMGLENVACTSILKSFMVRDPDLASMKLLIQEKNLTKVGGVANYPDPHVRDFCGRQLKWEKMKDDIHILNLTQYKNLIGNH